MNEEIFSAGEDVLAAAQNLLDLAEIEKNEMLAAHARGDMNSFAAAEARAKDFIATARRYMQAVAS